MIDEQMQSGRITLSVVSHGQSAMVNRLLSDLVNCQGIARIVITQNTDVDAFLIPPSLQDRTLILRNDVPKGFGENHNAAFQYCESAYYCVINPDIRLQQDPFSGLVAELIPTEIGMVAPMILNSSGEIEDSARRFPTPLGLLSRALRLNRGTYPMQGTNIRPDWVAGMFMLFKSEDFKAVHGFDERFFLYCEDADICLRLTNRHRIVLLTPRGKAIHDAQRSSHRHIRYLTWHISSILRLWRKHARRTFAL